MKTNRILSISAAAALAVGGLSVVHAQSGHGNQPQGQEDRQQENRQQGQGHQMQQGQRMGQGQQDARSVIAQWPETPKKVAEKMIESYGEPSGVIDSRLVWNDPQQGPWSEIIVSKEEVQHNFPMKHTDVLEQKIYYKVPPEKVGELAEYDGSVIVDRTKGTLSARCDKEAANFLALNLAHDIIEGEKSVEEAREAYADAIKKMMDGDPPETMKKLTFEPMSKEEARSPDEAVIQQGQ